MNRLSRRASASAARQAGPAPPAGPAATGPAQGRAGAAAPSPDSPVAQLHRGVSGRARSTSAGILASGRTVEAVHTIGARAAARGDAYRERSPTDPSLLACKKGCRTCCSRPVGTTAPSVLRLAAWLREHRTADELAEILRRIVALDTMTH